MIAVSVDGRIAATCRAFLDEGTLSYAAVVPPQLFGPGRNEVGVYAAGPSGSLTPLGGN
jgi:hypothetical protein